jgi:type II secretory pathway pseudopilin PulG
MAKVKPLSRTKRWQEAASKAVQALEELKEVQEEYQEWLDNLPENLQSNSNVAQKLEEVTNIDIESALNAAEEADGIDLPLGFGRD